MQNNSSGRVRHTSLTNTAIKTPAYFGSQELVALADWKWFPIQLSFYKPYADFFFLLYLLLQISLDSGGFIRSLPLSLDFPPKVYQTILEHGFIIDHIAFQVGGIQQ